VEALTRGPFPHSLKRRRVLATCNEDGVTLQMERNRLAAARRLLLPAPPMLAQPCQFSCVSWGRDSCVGCPTICDVHVETVIGVCLGVGTVSGSLLAPLV
jgi:hypothetical protein